MNNKYLIKNDILTVKEFSDFLYMALKDIPPDHQLKIKMNLRILRAYPNSKNPIKRFFQIKENYARGNARLAKQYDPQRKE